MLFFSREKRRKKGIFLTSSHRSFFFRAYQFARRKQIGSRFPRTLDQPSSQPTMIPALDRIGAKISRRPGISPLSFPQQSLIQRNHRGLQGFRYAHCPTSPRTINSIDSLKKYVGRRFLSTGGAKPGKTNPKSTITEATKSGSKSEPPVSSFSQFWKSFMGPKPMPERWTAAWYREMTLVCTVFAITGSSTMVLVSFSIELKDNGCMKHFYFQF